MIANNETFHRYLTEGIPVSYQYYGSERGDSVWLIDFENLFNNDFVVSNQLLLDLIRHFIVFEKTKQEDAKTGIVTINTIKKIAAYHQYYAVNHAVESTLRASGYIKKEQENILRESPASYGLPGVDQIWMISYLILLPHLNNCCAKHLYRQKIALN